MWYSSQQQQCSPRYIHHLFPQRYVKQSYSKTFRCRNTDELANRNQTPMCYLTRRKHEIESLVHYQRTCVGDVHVSGADQYMMTPNNSYSDEMSATSLPHDTVWNLVTGTSTETSSTISSIPAKTLPIIKPSSSSIPSACWDWLLYSPEIYSHLYIPSSSCIQQKVKDNELNLLASLPTWLLELLYPSMKCHCSTDDENETGQEISSLPYYGKSVVVSINMEKEIPFVSSTLHLSCTENPLHDQQHRSSTPGTDDGYQSASDASRSDSSQQSSLHFDHPHHHPSKDDVPSTLALNHISYAAAARPVAPLMNKKINSALTTPILKMKVHTSSLPNKNSSNTNEQKSKFIAPRFERIYHARQYSTPTTTTTTTKKDVSSSLTSDNRVMPRSNNNHNERRYLINASQHH